MEGLYDYIDYVLLEYNLKVFPIVNGFNVHDKKSSRIIFFSYNTKYGLNGRFFDDDTDIFSQEIMNFLKISRGEFILLINKWAKWTYNNI